MPNIALIVNNILSDSGVDLSGKADLVNGLVPASQLPSYVDDVLTYANLASFPATGETGKIYVANDTNKTYRWSGSAYIEISASPGSTDAVPEGTTNLYFTTARARAAISVSGSLSYNSSTGVISYTQPTNVSAFTNDAAYITTAGARNAISVSGSLSYNASTGVISYTQPTNISTFSNDSGYITTAGARSALSFAAGSGAYNSSTGVITIPTNTNQLTNGAGFITGYTETDTLASVTGRGNTTTTRIGVATSSPINLAASGNVGTWIGGIQDATSGWSISTNGIGLKADNSTYAGIVLADSNGILYFGRTLAGGAGTMNSWLEVNNTGIANFKLARPQHNGNNLALVSEIPTNLNQLTNGPGYITSYTETDTLATVTGRGASTSTNLSFTGTLSFGSATRQMINLWGTQYGIGIQSSTLYFRSDSRFSWHVGGSHNDSENNAGGGTNVMTLTTSGLSVGGHTVLHANNYGSYALPITGGTMTGQILSPSIGSDVYGGAIQIRERGYVLQNQSDWSYSPAITFHWGNRWAKRFGGRADGLFAIDDEPIALRSWVTSQGYITGYTETDTLASVTGRGASTASQVSFTKTDDHAISVGTIRGRAVGSQSGEFIQLYERVNIGGPNGWGAANTAAPSYGLSVFGGASIGYGNDGGLTVTGIHYSVRNTASGRGNLGFLTSSSTLGNIHMQNGAGPGNENSNQAAITFQGGTSSQAQAGIYVLNNNSYGTSMGFATTDSYATGPQLFMTATNGGVVNFPRATPTVAGNGIWHAGNDGSGSGLDADLLDGNHASAFALSTSLSSYLPLVGGILTGDLIITAANDTATGGGQIYINGANGNRIDFGAAGAAAPAFTTRSTGTRLVLYPELGAAAVDYALGIENNAMWYSVPVAGAARFFKWYGGTTNIATLDSSGKLTVANDVVAYGTPSDANLKTIKEVIPNALESIKKLTGYRFDWKNPDGVLNLKEDIGVIAQEVAAVLPELARTNGDGFMSVRYQGLTAVLIEAVKEQQAQIEDLKKQIDYLVENR